MTPAAVLVAAIAAGSASAQSPESQPMRLGDVVVAGSLRTRVETWNWFDDDPGGEYTYVGSLLRIGLARSKPSLGWRVEFALPILLGLPASAVAPGPRGQLGLGATYFAANDQSSTVAMLFPRQAFIEINRSGRARHSLRLGRMDVVDGAETTPKNATAGALKRDRIAHRLLGDFGFSHVGRSFDGARYALNTGRWNVTVFGGRPTRGVFDVNGWGEVRGEVIYSALTVQQESARRSAEWRLFALAYRDSRRTVLKTDNRPLASRREDSDRIAVGTFGGHWVETAETAAGTVDALFWGAIQTGSWGRLSHGATALAGEIGWQPRAIGALKPWLRAGYDRGSGDRAPEDSRHGTFFQVLPTPRVYARFPFFNLMNIQDRFVQIVLRPSNRLPIRADVHELRLADANDLWYSGGGMFQNGSFGYTGRPSGGRAGLATLYDVSAEYAATRRLGLGAYFGRAAAGPAIRATYANARTGTFGYLEATVRF